MHHLASILATRRGTCVPLSLRDHVFSFPDLYYRARFELHLTFFVGNQDAAQVWVETSKVHAS